MEKKKSDHIHIRINSTLKEKFNQICEQEHRSQAQQIEYWIENYKFKDKEKDKEEG